MLTDAELRELTDRVRSRTGRAEDARRARVILLLAEGLTWDDVCERAECSRGVFSSVADLKSKLMRYIRQYNKNPRVVKWHYVDPSRHIGA